MTKREQYLYIGGIVAIMILAGIFTLLLVQVLRPAPAVEPTPTLYEFPTEAGRVVTVAVTTQPEPTATQTTAPTRTAVPTATVDAEATQVAADYLALFDSLDQIARTTKHNFESTFGLFIEGAVSETDTDWQRDIKTLLAAHDGHIDQMRNMTPPADYADAHDRVIYGMGRCSLGWKIMFEAAKALDEKTYQDGVGYIQECNQSWTEGENLISGLRR